MPPRDFQLNPASPQRGKREPLSWERWQIGLLTLDEGPCSFTPAATQEHQEAINGQTPATHQLGDLEGDI